MNFHANGSISSMNGKIHTFPLSSKPENCRLYRSAPQQYAPMLVSISIENEKTAQTYQLFGTAPDSGLFAGTGELGEKQAYTRVPQWDNHYPLTPVYRC